MKLTAKMTTATGLVGLLSAILVGTGEFLLHFDTLGRFDERLKF